MSEDVSRRTMLKAAGAAGTAGMAGVSGCLDQFTGEEEFELLHAWSEGDGADAIQALVEGFEEEHPDAGLSVEDVPGAARQNLTSVIQGRLEDGDPPSTWQAWPGANLLQFTQDDLLGDIGDEVWDEDMEENYLDGPQEAARPDGTYVTVPINIHRINNLFYNVEVIEEAGVDPESIEDPVALVDAFEQVEQNTDATAFANGSNELFTIHQLWATVFLAHAGPDAYNQLIDGEFSDEGTMQETLEILAEYQQYFPDDAASINFTEANGRVMDGSAAFIHQGDWAAGAYRGRENFEYEEHWNQVPFPGTEGLYSLNMDSFPFPADNPTPENTRTFLSYCGTTDAQERFNPLKGSIPPRTDVDESEFPPFLQQQISDFQESEQQLPSIAHGAAVDPDTLSASESVINSFTGDWDPQAHAADLVDAFSN